MTSRSTASPSRLPSSAVPWILMCSTVTGFAPWTTDGTCVCTWAASRSPPATAIVSVTSQITRTVLIGILSRNTQLLYWRQVKVEAHPLHHGSREMTVTDFGSTVNVSLLPFRFAETGFGTTAPGVSNVFTL